MTGYFLRSFRVWLVFPATSFFLRDIEKPFGNQLLSLIAPPRPPFLAIFVFLCLCFVSRLLFLSYLLLIAFRLQVFDALPDPTGWAESK